MALTLVLPSFALFNLHCFSCVSPVYKKSKALTKYLVFLLLILFMSTIIIVCYSLLILVYLTAGKI